MQQSELHNWLDVNNKFLWSLTQKLLQTFHFSHEEKQDIYAESLMRVMSNYDKITATDDKSLVNLCFTVIKREGIDFYRKKQLRKDVDISELFALGKEDEHTFMFDDLIKRIFKLLPSKEKETLRCILINVPIPGGQVVRWRRRKNLIKQLQILGFIPNKLELMKGRKPKFV